MQHGLLRVNKEAYWTIKVNLILYL